MKSLQRILGFDSGRPRCKRSIGEVFQGAGTDRRDGRHVALQPGAKAMKSCASWPDRKKAQVWFYESGSRYHADDSGAKIAASANAVINNDYRRKIAIKTLARKR